MNPQPLLHKTAVVTGAARGIGYGIALRLAQEGANVVIADINADHAAVSARQIATETGRQAIAIACDVTDQQSVVTMITMAVSELGSLDIMVANAGVCPFVEVMEMDVETWKKTIDINLTGAFITAQAGAKQMVAQGKGGRIIFISSLATIRASSAQADYAASKSGVKMLMATMSTALGKQGITVNAIAPGVIYTEMGAFHWDVPEHRAAFAVENPIPRLGMPSDIANAAVFLALDESEYITGSTIRVDGGREAIG
ncbi:MAG: SDR family NAD(P)-dependent oxidoreductase [Armatimonadota bacterium]